MRLVYKFNVLVVVSCLSTLPRAQDAREDGGLQRRPEEPTSKLDALSAKSPIHRLRELKRLVPVGDATPRVREIQATLNEKLTGPLDPEGEGDPSRQIKLPLGKYSQRDYHKIREYIVRARAADIEPDDISFQAKKQVWTLVSDVDGFALKIRGDWEPVFSQPMPDPLDANSTPKGLAAHYDSPLKAIKLPKTPIRVDGVYGERTFTAVWLFQISNNLFPTGEVGRSRRERSELLLIF